MRIDPDDTQGAFTFKHPPRGPEAPSPVFCLRTHCSTSNSSRVRVGETIPMLCMSSWLLKHLLPHDFVSLYRSVREWALTAVDAYLAYKNATMLNYATSLWHQTQPKQLSADEASKGFSVLQNMPVASTCANGGKLEAAAKKKMTLTMIVIGVTTAGALFDVGLSSSSIS